MCTNRSILNLFRLYFLPYENKKSQSKSGPGRKSNAENAISFYEYALDKAIHSDDDEGEDKTIESMDSQEFLNNHNDDCDVCDEGGGVVVL